MKNTEALSENTKVLGSLSTLPEKMLRLHGTENVSEFVLYELCHEKCFNIPKAAFFIDNPDFKCFKGVAGFDKKEHPQNFSLWEEPEKFSTFMQQNAFNQKVRSINKCYAHASHTPAEAYLQDIAHQLDVRDLGFYKFPIKHGNDGYLIFDKHEADTHQAELLSRGACFLGFCPIF